MQTPEPKFETVTLERRGEIELLTLSMPQRLNALGLPMVDELTRYFEDCTLDSTSAL